MSPKPNGGPSVTKGKPPTPPPDVTWTVGSLNRIQRCPRQFRYADIDRVPGNVDETSPLDRSLRAVIRWAHESHIDEGRFPEVGDILREFDEVLEKTIDSLSPPPEDDEVIQRWSSEGHGMLRLFHKSRHSEPPPLAIDIPFKMELPVVWDSETRWTTIHGTVGRLDEIPTSEGKSGIGTIDYHAGPTRNPLPEQDREITLTLHQLAGRHLTGLPVVRTGLHYLWTGKESNLIRTEEELDSFRERVVPSVYRLVATGTYLPKTGRWCQRCPFKERCDAEGVPSTSRPVSGGHNGTAH